MRITSIWPLIASFAEDKASSNESPPEKVRYDDAVRRIGILVDNYMVSNFGSRRS